MCQRNTYTNQTQIMEVDELAKQMKSSLMSNKSPEASSYEHLFEKSLQQIIDRGGIPVNNVSKNEKIAIKKIEEGNKVLSSAPLNELIKIYNEAIAHAPCDSQILARAYANRSAVLTNGGLYEDSLEDIKRVFEIGYPDNLKSKLYARKARNLWSLNKKMCSEVKEAIAEANTWIGKTDDGNKKKILNNLSQLQTQSLNKPVNKWNDSLFMPKMSSENSGILRASSAISIQNSEKFGRHIVASKNIKAGEAVLIHKAYSSVLISDYWYTFCWNCIKFTYSCIPCSRCCNVIYCSEKCRDEAWTEHHDIECSVINGLLAFNKKSIEVNVACLRIFTKALKEFGNVEVLCKKVQELDQIKDPISKSLTEGVFDDTKYASVYALLRRPDFFGSAFIIEKSIETLFMLAATTKVFGRKIHDIKELTKINYGMFVGNLLFQHIIIVKTNCIMMMPNDDKGNVIRYAGALLPLLSLFSHSCDCNAYQYASGHTSAVVTIQPIKKGEQICISYGRHYYRDSSTFQRRLSLQAKHGFWCECKPCIKNWNPNHRLPSCFMLIGAKRNMNKLIQLTTMYVKFPSIVTSYQKSTRDKSPDDILRTITEISDLLNEYSKYVNGPCQEVECAKNLLMNIYMLIAGY